MSTKKVVSREYKIMLKAERFSGENQRMLEMACCFWKDFIFEIDKFVHDTDGDLDTIKTRRLITFYDTVTLCLRSNDYAFRERVEISSDTDDEERKKLPLNLQHPDRYLSRGHNMAASVGRGSKTKFEEDINPLFCSLFSQSAKQSINLQRTLQKMSDVTGIFPDVKMGLDCFTPDKIITAVRGFRARELVITGGNFQIGNNPKIEAECALIVWYDDAESLTDPVVTEFSFRYGDEDEHYDSEVVRIAYNVFQVLQQKMKKWVDPDSMTKTAYVFSR